MTERPSIAGLKLSGEKISTLLQVTLMVGLGVELYLLLGDVSDKDFAKRSQPTSVPIAELISRQNTVRVQDQGQLVWDETHDGQTLFKSQSILTLDRSKAEVAFLDGTGISIDEKSLILLERASKDGTDSQPIIVRLLHGTLHRKVSDRSTKALPLEIHSGDSRILVTPSTELSITANPKDAAGTRVQIQSGEAEIQSSLGKVSLKAGEEAALSETKAPEVRQLAFILLSPRGGQALQALATQQAVRFRWRARAETVSGTPQEIEVSRDPRFSTEVVRSRIAATEPPLKYVEINIDFPEPKDAELWYWRVKTAGNSSAIVSSIENFWLQPRLQPSQRPTPISIQAIPVRQDELPPPPSELDEPEIEPAPRHTRQDHSIWDWVITPAFADESENWSIKLKWRAVKNVNKYHIQIARDRNFAHLVTEAEIENPEWNWPYKPGMENSKGRLFYRVASVGSTGQVGAYSAPKLINIPKSIIQPETPPTQSVAAAPTVQVQPSTPWKWKTSLSTGLGALSQNSKDADLTSVRTQAAYPQQRVGLSLEIGRWLTRAQFGVTGFKPTDGARPPDQTSFKAVAWRWDVLINRQEVSAEHSTPWQLYYGASLDHSYRWIKSGPQAVDSSGALSLGPSAQVMRTYESGSFFALRETGAALSVPLSGLLSQGQAGIQGWIWAEWNLASFDQFKMFRLRAEADAAYLHWSIPSGTSTLAWSFWLAPVFCF